MVFPHINLLREVSTYNNGKKLHSSGETLRVVVLRGVIIRIFSDHPIYIKRYKSGKLYLNNDVVQKIYSEMAKFKKSSEIIQSKKIVNDNVWCTDLKVEKNCFHNLLTSSSTKPNSMDLTASGIHTIASDKMMKYQLSFIYDEKEKYHVRIPDSNARVELDSIFFYHFTSIAYQINAL